MLMLLTGGDRLAAQELWLRKVRIHLEAPQGAGASAPKAAQQVAGRRPKPAPARAQAVPKPRTAAQIARHERSQKQLRQKHLARKMWASVRIASRLLAWRIRAHALRCERTFFVNHPGLCSSMVLSHLILPIRVGKLLVQQWPSARARRPPPAALPAPPTSSAAAAQLLPAPALAAPPPPSQQPHLALAAAARASLDACEMQDDRGAKRDALARTPPRPAAPPTRPPPAEPRKKTRGVATFEAALAAAAPAAAAPQPHTDAATSHTFALSTANPYRCGQGSGHFPPLLCVCACGHRPALRLVQGL